MKNTYRACAEINLDALKHNIQEIQAVLGDTKLMCVIKTNAYGHGAVVLARELAAMGAYGFAGYFYIQYGQRFRCCCQLHAYRCRCSY